ncbi:hypothetical protein Agub_g13339 [Astrephomene gubernaculifera]|uniref:Uncharacterized protein n=1 Tax=Astrephomene gubernaculifera TaxID=47775 RepID=A0AAD3E1Z6_9CHLO|nr:hypothetical protein Agub_g13339 [Astrephomene gubernaculifera]
MASHFTRTAVGCSTSWWQEVNLGFGAPVNESNSIFTLLHSWFLPSTPANTGSKRLSCFWRIAAAEQCGRTSRAGASTHVACGQRRQSAASSAPTTQHPARLAASAVEQHAVSLADGNDCNPDIAAQLAGAGQDAGCGVVASAGARGAEEDVVPLFPAETVEEEEEQQQPCSLSPCSHPQAAYERAPSQQSEAEGQEQQQDQPSTQQCHQVQAALAVGTGSPAARALPLALSPPRSPDSDEVQSADVQSYQDSGAQLEVRLPSPAPWMLQASHSTSPRHPSAATLQPLPPPVLEAAAGSQISQQQVDHNSTLPVAAEKPGELEDGNGGSRVHLSAAGAGSESHEVSKRLMDAAYDGCFTLNAAVAAAAAAATSTLSCDGDSASVAESAASTAASTESFNPMAAAHAARMAFRSQGLPHQQQQQQPPVRLSAFSSSTSDMGLVGAASPAGSRGSSGWERTRASTGSGLREGLPQAGGRGASAKGELFGGVREPDMGRAYSTGGERPSSSGSTGAAGLLLPPHHPQHSLQHAGSVVTALSEPLGHVAAQLQGPSQHRATDPHAAAALAQAQLRLEHMQAKHMQLWRQYERLSATHAAQAARQEGVIAQQEEALRGMRRHCEELAARNRELQMQLRRSAEAACQHPSHGGGWVAEGGGCGNGSGGGGVGRSSYNGGAMASEHKTSEAGSGLQPMRQGPSLLSADSSSSSSGGGRRGSRDPVVAARPVRASGSGGRDADEAPAAAAAIRFHSNPLTLLSDTLEGSTPRAGGDIIADCAGDHCGGPFSRGGKGGMLGGVYGSRGVGIVFEEAGAKPTGAASCAGTLSYEASVSSRGMKFGAGMTTHDNPLAAADAPEEALDGVGG